MHISISFKHISSFLILLSIISSGLAVRCYQCASSNDEKGQDSCGAYKRFDTDRHQPVECNSQDSTSPGFFCMKVTQQSPKGFIWDGRWRQVIRRCASVAETGVAGVCNWGVYENGIYWEECYCLENGCNGVGKVKISIYVVAFLTSCIVLLNLV